jgi:hypothetical protein
MREVLLDSFLVAGESAVGIGEDGRIVFDDGGIGGQGHAVTLDPFGGLDFAGVQGLVGGFDLLGFGFECGGDLVGGDFGDAVGEPDGLVVFFLEGFVDGQFVGFDLLAGGAIGGEDFGLLGFVLASEIGETGLVLLVGFFGRFFVLLVDGESAVAELEAGLFQRGAVLALDLGLGGGAVGGEGDQVGEGGSLEITVGAWG